MPTITTASLSQFYLVLGKKYRVITPIPTYILSHWNERVNKILNLKRKLEKLENLAKTSR
jgi:hypothetical protein